MRAYIYARTRSKRRSSTGYNGRATYSIAPRSGLRIGHRESKNGPLWAVWGHEATTGRPREIHVARLRNLAGSNVRRAYSV